MKFKFNIRLTDKDYLDFNKFWMLKTPYGKKQISLSRKLLYLIFAIGIFIVLFMGEITTQTYITIGGFVVLCLLFQALMARFFILSLKIQIKTMKKSGKMPFSEESNMEFYDETFIEYTTENKNEHKYSAIDRVSVVGGQVIYIHLNNVMAYMLPFDSFESVEEYNRFFDFIKTKVNIVDIY